MAVNGDEESRAWHAKGRSFRGIKVCEMTPCQQTREKQCSRILGGPMIGQGLLAGRNESFNQAGALQTTIDESAIRTLQQTSSLAHSPTHFEIEENQSFTSCSFLPISVAAVTFTAACSNMQDG